MSDISMLEISIWRTAVAEKEQAVRDLFGWDRPVSGELPLSHLIEQTRGDQDQAIAEWEFCRERLKRAEAGR